MANRGGAEDKFVQTLLEEGPGGFLLVESKMVRGSTHDKDRTTFTALVEADKLSEELADLRDAQKLDMADRRAYDPEGNPNDQGGGR